MYKYFKELDNPTNFKIYLVKMSNNKKKYQIRTKIPKDFLQSYEDLFHRLDLIDMLVEGEQEELVYQPNRPLSYEEWRCMGEFFAYKSENYPETKDLRQTIDINTFELEYLLDSYSIYNNYLMNIHPDKKEFFTETNNRIKEALKELERKTSIDLPPTRSAGVEMIWPNAWYITPNGMLYNTGLGHKEGNLEYSYDEIIRRLENNQEISNVDHRNQIRSILERGYVTSEEFRNYANLIYNIPTVLTPEIDQEIERYKRIIKMSYEERKKIIDQSGLPHIERSYQPNIIKLVTGYLDAKDTLYQSFMKLNDSKRKKDNINKIHDLANQDLRDVLVRYAGFHKIESCERKITTSSPYAIEQFQEYLEKGWDLYIVPKIVYDKTKDEVEEMNFEWYYLDKHFDKRLDQYHEKGKVLIRGKNI